jgi:hypothetical protein
MAHDKNYEITVNGTEDTVPDQLVSYEQVIALAYPNQPPSDTITYKVTFEKAQSKPHEGTLAPGGKIEVKKHGTIFDVVQANRS